MKRLHSSTGDAERYCVCRWDRLKKSYGWRCDYHLRAHSPRVQSGRSVPTCGPAGIDAWCDACIGSTCADRHHGRLQLVQSPLYTKTRAALRRDRHTGKGRRGVRHYGYTRFIKQHSSIVRRKTGTRARDTHCSPRFNRPRPALVPGRHLPARGCRPLCTIAIVLLTALHQAIARLITEPEVARTVWVVTAS
jgi:hypothetical protein